MIRLSQSWVMRYPLIDVHGNNGTILGDGPAAARYTESRLSNIAEDGLLQGLKKHNVDFAPTYDETEQEPITLPAIFPNLLCNPNEGIGWAMGCSWAPHNLREVRDAIMAYLNDEEPMLPGPDFPTGGIVINKRDIPAIMRTGHGTVKIRGKYNIKGNNITFYEIPYGTRVESLMDEIGAASDAEQIPGILEVRNETGKNGVKLTIEVAKTANIQAVISKLFAKTDLQSSFSYNQIALIGKTPIELNLKDAIQVYVDHNIDCIIRETKFDLNKAEARKEIVDGLLRALEDIDNIIKLIKSSSSSAAAKEALIAKYNFTENQAKAIIDMKLGKLANLEKIELQEECAKLEKLISNLNTLMVSKDAQIAELKMRLNSLVDKYGDARRTELTDIEAASSSDEAAKEVIPEDVVVIASKNGDIKRVAASAFKPQNRRGKGVKSDEDILETIRTNTADTLLIFTDKGLMYRLLADKIPTGTNVSKGVKIHTLVKMDADEHIECITSLNKENNKTYVGFFTKNGLFKKTELSEYTSIKRSTGIQAIKLKDGDSLANVLLMDEQNVIVVTERGQAIMFETSIISPIGRATSGVKSIKLEEGDSVICGLLAEYNKNLAIFTENGFGKQTRVEEIPIQGRAGKGVCIYKRSIGTGYIVGAIMVGQNDNVLLSGSPNSICISCKEIPVLDRATMGNIMIKGSKVKSVSKVG